MNDLAMCKAIAKLEGIKTHSIGSIDTIFTKTFADVGPEYMQYNPIADLALNCALRDKHQVEIDYGEMRVSIYTVNSWFAFDYFTKREMNHAVIFCILKANGLYVGGEDE